MIELVTGEKGKGKTKMLMAVSIGINMPLTYPPNSLHVVVEWLNPYRKTIRYNANTIAKAITIITVILLFIFLCLYIMIALK